MSASMARFYFRPFWTAFVLVFAAHFFLLVVVFFNAMSWSLLGPTWLPLQFRMAAADALLFVVSFPLSLIMRIVSITSESFLVGWLVYASVSALWAYVLAKVWCRYWGRGHNEARAPHAG
jgi:hypothetical protein